MKISYTPYIFACIISFLVINQAKAQFYGNEWIDYNQSYYKIPVAQTGMYKVSYNDLANAGFPVGSTNPKKIQLFHRGAEQAINIVGEGDDIFDPTDYIEFYGQRNDGTQDSILYEPKPQNQLNKYYNLYSDTTAYFLTWRLDAGSGKRMNLVNEPNNAYPVEPYHWEESLNLYNIYYNLGQSYAKTNPNAITYLSNYDVGEGWVGAYITKGGQIDYTINVSNLINDNNLKPKLEILIVGGGNTNHNIDILVGNSINTLTLKSTRYFQGYEKDLYTTDLDLNDITGTGQMIVRFKANGYNNTTQDYVATCYIKLTYAQTYDMNGNAEKYFFPTLNAGDKSYLEINNVPASTTLYDITDKNSLQKIASNQVGNLLTAVVAGTAEKRKLYTTSLPKNINSITKINFQNIDPTSYDYILISHPSIMKAGGGYNDVVQAYADYRASLAGGSYKPLVVDINLLYNQFNYGERSAAAIRTFMKYLYKKGTPKYLLLVGKGITMPAYELIYDIRNNPAHAALDLVPTGGFPGSDVPLVSFDVAYPYAPSIPVGRLAVTNPIEVANYLDKVKEHESATGNLLWKKDFLHLSGGSSNAQQTLFKSFVNNFKSIAQGEWLGAQVKTVSKKTDNASEFISITNEVNTGVGMVTFFGHSAPTISDIEIGAASDPSQGYKNKGKYPMILANGCRLGEIYSNVYSLGQDWLYTANKGAILWVGNSFEGLDGPLYTFSLNFYKYAFASSSFLGKSVGDIMKQVARSYGNTNQELDISHFQQMMLQGDPAISITLGDKPDYYTNDSWLSLESFVGDKVTAEADSFKINIIAANLAKTTKTPFAISVKRTFGDGQIYTYLSPIDYDAITYKDTISFTIKNMEGFSNFGNNIFEVKLDYKDAIDELKEDNNIAILEYFIPAASAIPIFPPQYSIVSTQPVNLIAQSGSLKNENKPYLIEIDTTYTFNSGFKKSQVVPAGLLPMWSTSLAADIPANDSIVYYWRVKYADELNNPNILWGESSFTYIKGSPSGWSQGRFPQLLKAQTVNITKDEPTKKLKFREIANSILVNTFGNTNPNPPGNVTMSLNSQTIVSGNSGFIKCGNNSMVAMVFNKQTALPYLLDANYRCGKLPEIADYYSNPAIQANALLDYLNNVPNGDYVLLFNLGQVDFDTWSPAMKNALQSIGANPATVNNLHTGHPYIILGQKGAAPSSAIEIVSLSINDPTGDAINLAYDLDGKFSEGTLTSTRIGPASEWGNFYKDFRSLENPNTDTYELDIIGVTINGQETILGDNVAVDALPLNFIDAAQYPYLKLNLYAKDTDNLTPTQIRKWLVTYDGVPEGVLNVDAIGAEKYKITDKQEGEKFTLEFAFQNISTKDFADSLTVQYTNFNKSNNQKEIKTTKIKALKANELVKFSFTVETLGKAGENNLKVFVNPYLQTEQYYDNNILDVPYRVLPDKSNPLLEVAFDGRQIMDGEIVSPSPLIGIRLKDENKYIIRKDTVGLDVYLKKPCQGCVFERINFTNPDIKWRVENSNTQIDFNPKKLPNGIYTLRVQATDAQGNLAGVAPYQINFEVINESTVTNFFPYPNPFSSKTQFVFTLTGKEVPQQMKIQIMTISGKVVREITQDELGPVYIGNNRTQFAWDGTDEFGDKLANGVYLYRVLMKNQNEAMEHRTTSADKGFHKGFGKIYILR